MKIKTCILLLFVILPQFSIATGNPFPAGARNAGMGETSTFFADHWAIFYNPAAMAGIEKFSLGISTERKFMLAEINSGAMAFAIPINKMGVAGGSISAFGNEFYRQSRYAISYSRKINRISAGVKFNLFHTFIHEYGNTSALAGETGMILEVNRNLNFGMHIFNPTLVKNNPTEPDKLPIIAKAGVSYLFSDKVTAALDVEKQFSLQQRMKSGLEYKASDAIFLRTGMQTNPAVNTFGAGFNFSKIRFDIAFSYHRYLGSTPFLSVDYYQPE
jgi:hypothetical protein